MDILQTSKNGYLLSEQKTKSVDIQNKKKGNDIKGAKISHTRIREDGGEAKVGTFEVVRTKAASGGPGQGSRTGGGKHVTWPLIPRNLGGIWVRR